MLGDHGRFKKSTFHESNVRIPPILRWPGRIHPNGVSEALAEIVDVFPTLLAAAGCATSPRSFGRSLWPALIDPRVEIRSWQLAEVRYGDRQFMLRSQRCKFAVDSESRAYMLYDLVHDPNEQHNLAVDPAARPLKLDLRQALSDRLEETGYRGARAVSDS